MTTEVIKHYEEMVDAVTTFIQELGGEFECDGLPVIKDKLFTLCQDFGVKAPEVEKILQENNKIEESAAKLMADELVYIRITGTMFVHMSSIASLIYDIEQGLQAVGVLNEMIGTVLILEEAGY